MRELLSTLLYWHERDTGHIDESWWDEARKLCAPSDGGEGGERG